MGKTNEMKLVYVEWEDAYSRDSWQTSHDLDLWRDQRFMVQQSGFVYFEDRDCMILTGGINPGDEHGEIQYKQAIKIPRSWISVRVDLTKYIKLCLNLNTAERKKIDELLTTELKKLEKKE